MWNPRSGGGGLSKVTLRMLVASTVETASDRPEVAKLWEPGYVSVGSLSRLYAEYPYMPRLKPRGH